MGAASTPSMALRLRIEVIVLPSRYSQLISLSPARGEERLRKLFLVPLHLLAIVLGVAVVDMVVNGELLLAQLLRRRLVEIEVAVLVGAAHQHRRHALRPGRAH